MVIFYMTNGYLLVSDLTEFQLIWFLNCLNACCIWVVSFSNFY